MRLALRSGEDLVVEEFSDGIHHWALVRESDVVHVHKLLILP